MLPEKGKQKGEQNVESAESGRSSLPIDSKTPVSGPGTNLKPVATIGGEGYNCTGSSARIQARTSTFSLRPEGATIDRLPLGLFIARR